MSEEKRKKRKTKEFGKYKKVKEEKKEETYVRFKTKYTQTTIRDKFQKIKIIDIHTRFDHEHEVLFSYDLSYDVD